MFDRFTDRSRKVMGYARQEAQRLRRDRIGTEHILLGLAKEGSGVAMNVLENLGVEKDGILAEIERRVEKGSAEGPVQRRFSDAARRALDHAMEEARELSHKYVGTEHLLLGLLRTEGSTAAEALDSLEVKLDGARREVAHLLGVEAWKGAAPVPAGPEPEKGEVVEFSEEVKALEQVIREKQAAVAAQHFERAAELRDKAKGLREEIAAKFLSGASALALKALAYAAEEAGREGSDTIEFHHLRRGIERAEKEDKGKA